MKLGILDIGTNSIHMILVEIKKDLSIEVLDRAKEFTRLGDNTFRDNKLSDEAIDRALIAVRRFKKLADIRGVQRIKAVATSAVREALNGGDLIDQIQKETGIRVRVITGEEEARLIYQAVKHSVPMTDEPYLIIDIGGGSVELIVTSQKGMLAAFSVKLGAVRLKDLFIRHDPPTKKEMRRLHKYIGKELEPILPKIEKYKIKTIIGTSGTMLNLAAMAHWQNSKESIGNVSNFRIDSQSLLKLNESLIKSDARDRAKNKGLDPQRSDIIVPGSVLLSCLLKKGSFKDVILSDAAIREGLLYDYLEKNRSKIELEGLIPNIRLRSVMQLARQCDFSEQHAQQVSRLALSLFDQTQTLHGLRPLHRELLNYAALLHDIGHHINYKKHQKHTYYLIKNGDLNGFEEWEIELIANMARYHCKSIPKKSHPNWKTLPPKDQRVVSVGASILRLADGLDRSHFSVIEDVRCRLNGNKITLRIIPRGAPPGGDPELEIWAANHKKDYFEEVFDKELRFNFTNRAAN